MCQKINATTNPHVNSIYKNFMTYKNKEDGISAHFIGAVQMLNITAFDNVNAGIEINKVKVADGVPSIPQIKDSFIAGYTTELQELCTTRYNMRGGIITSRKEYTWIDGVTFMNMDKPQGIGCDDRDHGYAAIGTCSECHITCFTDSGARTTFVKNLQFIRVDKRIKYNYPWRAIIRDEDGSLTGSKGWATPVWEHNRQPQCSDTNSTIEVYNGFTCNDDVQIRSVIFH